MQKIRRKPAYFSTKANSDDYKLIFISSDWNALNLVRKMGGYHCMLCEQDPLFYDLTFCANKEIWIFYSGKHVLYRAITLGRIIQFLPAKVTLIEVGMKSLKEVENGKC